MQAAESQVRFFRYIKDKLPANFSLVDEVADILNVSNESAYRRIQGEITLQFDEIQLLAKRFSVSLDQFLDIFPQRMSFSGSFINRDKFNFENYLQGIVQQLQMVRSAQSKEIFYLNKDIPIFHHFMFPELAAFKCYFWSRYNLNTPQYNKGKFLIEDFIDIFNKTGKEISNLYLQIPSTEIWNSDCINTTIRQIDYYRECEIFESEEDILTVYNCLEKLVSHIEKQVDIGCKFPFEKVGENKNVKYTVYVNEFVLGDNAVILQVDGQKFAIINHSVINYIQTSDPKFVEYLSDTFQILLKKSTLISEIDERDRRHFFDTMRRRIHEKKKLI